MVSNNKYTISSYYGIITELIGSSSSWKHANPSKISSRPIGQLHMNVFQPLLRSLTALGDVIEAWSNLIAPRASCLRVIFLSLF